jgi:HK97 family phage portal protein
MMQPLRWFWDMFKSSDESSMTVSKSLTSAAFFYGVRKISNNFSMLPCSLYRKQNRSNAVQANHASHKLLKDKPNAFQSPLIYKQQHLNHALLWGNGRAYIHRVNGVAVELIPLMPDRTMTIMIEGEKFHLTKPERDDRFDLVTDMRQNPEETVTLPDSDVFHTMGFTLDGFNGISIVRLAANTLGIDTASDNHSMKQLKKGYAGGLMLEAPPGAFREEGKAKEFLEQFRNAHDGDSNAGKTGLLREGIKANVLAMSNSDAQLLENRKFTRQQIALWLGLETILGDDNSVSYNSLEQKVLSYLMNCLGAWLTQYEEQANMKLLTESERARGFYFKFNDGALLRSDKAATAQFVSQLISATVISRNEARSYFDMNPVEGGDKYENPNTSAPNKAQPTEPAPSQPPASNSAAVESQIRHMIRVESKRVMQHAKDSNFLSWMDKWYADWEGTLADKLEEIGLDRNLATKHCDESKKQLVEATDSKPEQFEKTLENCVKTWENRVFSIINSEETEECLV